MGFESVLINNQRNGTRETWKMPTNFRKEGTHSVILAENCTRELSPLVQIFLKIMLHTITADNTIVNWAALVRDMLFNLGFGYAWMQHGVANRTFFISLFKQRLRDNDLGDEFHCLFECENTRHIKHVLPRYYTFRPNMLKLSSLLSSEEPSVLRKLFFIST